MSDAQRVMLRQRQQVGIESAFSAFLHRRHWLI
jgi:hypothetical protein